MDRTPATVVAWRSQESARAVARIYPRIVLEHCSGCVGKGSYRIGAREYACLLCNGRGTIAVES